MSFSETALLGALAGSRSFSACRSGACSSLSARARVALAMFSVGILVFLLVDVLAHGFEIAEERVEASRTARQLRARRRAGAAAGRRLRARQRRPRHPRAAPARPRDRCRRSRAAPSTRSRPTTPSACRERRRGAQARALRTGLIIAAAIGLHNFAEGLAIGVSARRGRDRPRHGPDHRLRPAQRDRGLRHRRPARQRPPDLALARARRPDRRRPDVPRLAGRLQRHLRAARAVFLRARGRRDPLRDRRDLERHAPLGHRELGLLLLAAGFAAGVAHRPRGRLRQQDDQPREPKSVPASARRRAGQGRPRRAAGAWYPITSDRYSSVPPSSAPRRLARRPRSIRWCPPNRAAKMRLARKEDQKRQGRGCGQAQRRRA